MELAVYGLQPRGIDVRIDLRRGDAGVAQHLLHLPQVGPAGKHVRGETVPHGVGTDLRRRTGAEGVAFHQFPDPLAPQTAAAIGEQDPLRRRRNLRGQAAAFVLEIRPHGRAALAPSGTIRCLSPLPRQMQ